MIGNDIIDLALARKESNWKREGFLEKLFTAQEQALIVNSNTPEITVWNLWSRKEAAYKIYNRQTKIRAYIPLQLECFDIEIKDGFLYGKVICYDTIYFTKTEITSEYIETFAVVNPIDFDKIKTIHCSEIIIKTDGIPDYFGIENKIWKPVSKSHHGRFERIISFHDICLS
ncbi:4'-phosphopantetheinyl transferase superfamily protein [Flavobacterium sp.]|uniref:4'-phosphopantetheinyl transferase family protein n=1 Tax=Flavobacterium sp. TaxID=239 RepID=UPI00248856D8|nr:4'-phosphopantetheinyl transferase superfamily protein [Flavobacterium sp.]MDI1316022.1 4'-phosphopantetheinyl transferase superfamily protein [Flavobacterium sp.]